MRVAKYKLCVKIISLIVLVTFLNTQILWAADGLGLTPVQKEVTPQYSPSQVDQTYSNTAQQVDRLSNIEELRARNFSSRTPLSITSQDNSIANQEPLNTADLFDMTLVSPAEIKGGETLKINFVLKDDNSPEDGSERVFKWESISYKDNTSYISADKDDIIRLDGADKNAIELSFSPDADDAGEYLFEFTVEEGNKKTVKSLKVTVNPPVGQAPTRLTLASTSQIQAPLSLYQAPQASREIASYLPMPFLSSVIRRPPQPRLIIERKNISYIDNTATKGEYITNIDLAYKGVEYWPYPYNGYYPANVRAYSFKITIKENKDFTDIFLNINLGYYAESSNMRIQSKSIFENLDNVMSKIRYVLFNSNYLRYLSHFYPGYSISHRKALYLVVNDLQRNVNIIKEERIKKQEGAVLEIQALRDTMTSDLTYKELSDIKTALDTKAVSVYLEPTERQSQLTLSAEKFNTIHSTQISAVDSAIENGLNDTNVTYTDLALERDNLLVKVTDYLSIEEQALRKDLIENKYKAVSELRKALAINFINDIRQTMETSLLAVMSPDILRENKDNLIARIENSLYLEPEEKTSLTSEITTRYDFVATPPTLKPLPDFINKGNLLIEWDTKEGATSYILEIASNPEFTESSLINSLSTLFELTGLEPGKAYYLRLKADKDSLTTSWTNASIIDKSFMDSLGNLIEYKDGLITKLTDPNGIVSTYNYSKDTAGNIVHKIITRQGETRRYDINGDLISITDIEGNNHKFSYTRDAQGVVITTTETILTPLEDIKDIITSLNQETNLIESYNDSSYIAYTYDQALAIISFSIAGDYTNAEKALITMRSLQLPDGSWYEGYDTRTKAIRSNNRYSGPIAFMIMAINWYTSLSGNRDFIPTAEKAGEWLLTLQNMSQTDPTYGSVKGGYEYSNPVPWISTEHNLDIYASLKQLSDITGRSYYLDRALLIESYLKTKMWNNERFYTGYNDAKEYLDPQTFGILALGNEYDSAMNWASNILGRNLLYNGSTLDGYDMDRSSWQPNPKDTIWLEGTGQASLTWLKLGYSDYWSYYLDQINYTRLTNGGFIYSINESLPITYPYNWQHKSIASTAWHFLAASKTNPFDIPQAISPIELSAINISDALGNKLIVENDMAINLYSAEGDTIRKINPDSSYFEYFYDDSSSLLNYHEYLPDGSINVFDNTDNLIYSYNSSSDNTETIETGSMLSVKTSTDDVIRYQDNKISSVTLKEDGSVMTGIELYPDGTLKNAHVKYLDGSIDIIYEGVLLQKISSKGVISRYRDGKKTIEYAPLTGINAFHSLMDKDGNIAYNMLVNKEVISTYDAQGFLIKTLKQDRRLAEYDSGRLQRLVTSDGKEYLYNYISGDSPKSVLIGETIDETIPSIIRYDQNNSVIELLNIKGDSITYSDELIESIVNEGISTQYQYAFNSQGELEQVEVDRLGLKRLYDGYGNLASINLGDDSKVVYEEGELKAIEQSDGTIITPLEKIEFDENGNLVTGKVTSTDGTVKEYKNKTLDFFKRPDGIMLDLEDGKIKSLVTPEDDRYNWQYLKDEDGTDITLIEDLARKETRKYKNGLLWSIANEYGLEIKYEYLDQKISKSIVKNYGRIIQTYIYAYIGNTVEITDGDGLKRVYSEEEKIISLTTPEGKKYNYTYELDTEGNEKTIVQLVEINGSKDFPSEERIISEYNSQNVITRSVTKGGAVTYYINGLTDKIVDKDGYTIADYEYDSDYNIISLSLDSARESLSREVTSNEEAITKERDNALTHLSQEEARVKQQIAEQIAPIRADIVKQKREFEQIMDINFWINLKGFSHFLPFLQEQQEKKNVKQINEDINWMREEGIAGINLGWMFSWFFSNGEVKYLYSYNPESKLADSDLAWRVYFYVYMYYTYRYVQYGDNTMYSGRIMEIEHNSVEWWDNNWGVLITAENDLNQQEAKAYQDLATQIAQQRQIIYDREAKSLQKLHEEERLIKQEISAKESIPLVYFWYRKVIGRDPSNVEVDYWISKAKQNLKAPEPQVIIDYLESLPEYTERVTDKETIIEDVRSFFTDYLNATEVEKSDILKELGLDNSEVVSLDSYKIDKIVSWLNSVGLHFGDSAYLALKELLDNEGLNIPKIEIARLSIIIDILTGVINEETDGNLLLSMYSLNKVAKIKGLTLYSAKISFEELRETQKPLIAHVDDNHYIVITKIENDKVTYLDPGIGETPEEVTTSVEEFQGIWKGYVLISEAPQNPENIITSEEAKSVRGAFFGIIIAIVAAIISAVTTAVVVAATILTTVISVIATAVSVIASAVANVIITITQLVSAAIANIAQGIGTFFTWVGEGLKFAGNALINIGSKALEGIKIIGSKLFEVVTHPINVIQREGLAAFFTESVRDVAINYGVSTGLKETGLDPTVSNILSAVVSGGITGGIDGGMKMAWEDAITSGTITGVQELGEETGLDPKLTSIAAITSGAIVSGTINGNNVDDILKDISPNIVGELAYVGVQELGENLGVDPRISYLAGMPIRSAIAGGLNGDFTEGLKNGIKQGLSSGVTAVSLEWAMKEMDIDPLVGAIGGRVVSGAIEGLLTKTGFLDGIFNGILDTGGKTLTLGDEFKPPDPNSAFYQAHPELLEKAWAQYNWNQSVYLSKALNLSNLIEERGIGEALESVAESIFFRDTIESIWKQGGLADLVTGNAVVTYNNKKQMDVRRVYLNSEGTDFIDLTLDGKDVVAIQQGNIYENSTFFYGPDGKAYPKNSTKWIDNPDGTQTIEHIMNFKLTLSEKYDPDGIMLKAVYTRSGQDAIVINQETGQVLDGRVIDFENGYEYTIKEGKIVEFIDKQFLSQDDNRSFLGMGGAYFKEMLAIDEYEDADLDKISLKITDNDGDVEVSVGFDGEEQVNADTLNVWHKLSNYVKDIFLSSVAQSTEIYGGKYIKVKTGQNSYVVVDKEKGYTPVEIYRNGLKLVGDLEKVDNRLDGSQGYRKVINGGIIYDIDTTNDTYLVVKIDDRKPSYVKYIGSSDQAVFNGTKDQSDKLIDGELNIRGRDVIVFQGGSPIGYYKADDPNHLLKSLDYGKIEALVTNIIIGNAQVSQNGIYNKMSDGAEPDFVAYHNAIRDTYNQLFPDKPITVDAVFAVFKNSAPAENVWKGLLNLNFDEEWDLVKDPAAVVLNQGIDQLTDEVRGLFNSKFGNSSNALNGYSFIFESGSKTSSMRLLNEDVLRVYTAISISGNISDKISNPYVKLFVNFTSNNEIKIGEVKTNYKVEDIFRYPDEDRQVFNIQFDDKMLKTMGYPSYGHVDYARDPDGNHPYHQFFVTAAALAEHAVYDGGASLKNFIMKAKGFSDDSQFSSYLSQNNNIIKIDLEDVNRIISP